VNTCGTHFLFTHRGYTWKKVDTTEHDCNRRCAVASVLTFCIESRSFLCEPIHRVQYWTMLLSDLRERAT
jgi:hypothetical protein